MKNRRILIIALVALALAAGCQSQSTPVGPARAGAARSLLVAAEGTAIGDFVWLDENDNGIQDSSEAGLADVAVELYTCEDSALMASVTTDSTGVYCFDNLEPGSYYVHFVLPDGYQFSPTGAGEDSEANSDADPVTGNTACVTLEQDQQEGGLDAGMYLAIVCPRGKGYWKNHAGFGPQADVVTPLLPLSLGADGGDKSLAVEDAQTAVDVLSQFTYGEPSNGITKLYAHMLAAKLNEANGVAGDMIADAQSDAETFLADHSWEDWDGLSDEDRQQVMEWKDLFESFNEGYMSPTSCANDDGEMEEDGD